MPKLLTSWKEIAQYTGKGVRTVQRWEREFGLPVRRLTSDSHHAIIGVPEDIDAWVQRQKGTEQREVERLRAEVRRLQAELNAYRQRQLPHAESDRTIAA
jgi:hypothetical protein